MSSLVHNNGISPEPDEERGWDIEIADSELSRVVDKKGSGAYLTWEDLEVAVSCSNWSLGKDECKSLLTGSNGFAKPGEIVAIMGPSGCGKSTLLDSLARRLASNTRHTGRILINGRKQKYAYGTLAYMTQEQVLTWTLTVKETVYYSAELQLPKLMRKSEKRDIADRIIREMGLQDSLNTRIGGWGLKGLSGGQKRRVSICLELLTQPKILLLDEPTSGLDSAASYYVMNQIVKLTQQYGMTVLAAIHQPSSQVFGLFNSLCLLSLGKTIYFGPTFATNQFFAVNGFPCPALQSPAEHFLITINTDFNEDTVTGAVPVDQIVNALAESYKLSQIYKEAKSEIAKICGEEGDLIERKESLQANFITQTLVLSERSFKNMHRDLGYYWVRLAIYIALGFALGTVFYQIGYGFGSINARVSMIMFVSSFLTILAIGGFPSFVEEMKVFQWERLNGRYGVGSYVISHAISSMPYLFVISLFPGAIAYSLMGLQREPEQFIYFELVLFVSMLLVECLMMIVACIVPKFTSLGLKLVLVIQGLDDTSADSIPVPKRSTGISFKPNVLTTFLSTVWRYKNVLHNETEVLKVTES
ncbi:ABC transporter G family member 11-like protein [Tanacetum coccineum]